MILRLINEATTSGAGLRAACRIIGLDVSTIKRWKKLKTNCDQRKGPEDKPQNALSDDERKTVLRVVNSAEFRNKSPRQIVPLLADQGQYLCSESTMYRILKGENQLAHRGPSKEPTKRSRPSEYKGLGPNGVWSWDITYLRAPIRGTFFYLYMFIDVWSRKVVGWEVHLEENAELAAHLIEATCKAEGVSKDTLVLHSDNGAPMKAGTTQAMLLNLGVAASFSRPSVSNDNPFSESCFRTVKSRPSFPIKPFDSLAAAREWVATFVAWYNTEHLHSSINFLPPSKRHEGAGEEILENRARVYEAARGRHPERWSGKTRDWSNVAEVTLNPTPEPEDAIPV